MKKFFKALALVLALALVIGVVPAQATSAKIKAKKTLYVDGAKGTNADGTKTSSYKERVAIYKLAGAKKADKEDHKFTAKLKSGDSVTVSKNYVYAAGLGKSVVELFKDGESLGTSVITVKKNATADTLTITEFEDGKEVVCGVEYTVTLPRKGVDTDERRLFVDDKAVEDKEDAPRAYAVKFTKAGDHKVKFEAFQSAELDKATASKEITVKATMPKPVSAKQVSATSFAVEFEGNMEDLITKDDITNQMIYYLIANTPVVTGVVKTVEVKDKVVTVTMFANFNSDTDYYFAYGDVEPIKFHTAKNDIKYATSLKLVEAKAYYVGQDTAIEYKFYNADGVELNITDIPALEVVSDYAYGIGTNIYFHTEGTATIKASIVTGYDDETNAATTLTDTLTVTGVKKTTTQTGKVYSFSSNVSDAKHQIRVTDAGGATELMVKYTLSDGDTATIDSTSGSYYLKSTDETVAMIAGSSDKVYGINPGTATIVLYDASNDSVLDAFPITVLEANKVGSATATLSKETLNLADLGVSSDPSDDDAITLTVKGLDLDGKDSDAYEVGVKQLENNEVATKIGFTEVKDGDGIWKKDGATRTFKITTDDSAAYTCKLSDGRTKKDDFATVRLVVTVKNKSGETVLSKTLSFAVSEQKKANSYKLTATANALENSLKNWGKTDLSKLTASIGVNAVKTTSYGDFFVSAEKFALVKSVNNIPVTSATGTAVNYVIFSAPTVGTGNVKAWAQDTGNYYDQANDRPALAQATTGEVKLEAFHSATDRTQPGTYTFTGYHVEFGNDYKGVRTSLGTQSVVISRSDVQATATIVNGKAKNFNDNYATLPTAIFKVSWADKTTNDKNDGRVQINALAKDTNWTYDEQSKAYYCKKITVKLFIEDSETYYFTQDITINKLFKND